MANAAQFPILLQFPELLLLQKPMAAAGAAGSKAEVEPGLLTNDDVPKSIGA
jgi:hypothetical protein